MRTEHLDLFYKNLLDFAENNISEKDLAKVTNIDGEMNPDEITLQTVETLEAFEPFGVGNHKPKFMISNVEISDCVSVGKDAKHLQLKVNSLLSNGSSKVFMCIAFNFGKVIEQLRPGNKVDLVFELIADSWQGRKNIKLRVIDFRKVS
ncbi:MAG: hypothetical protein NVSMB66_0800 [Candidatus Doudnabacteria bacterium]